MSLPIVFRGSGGARWHEGTQYLPWRFVQDDGPHNLPTRKLVIAFPTDFIAEVGEERARALGMARAQEYHQLLNERGIGNVQGIEWFRPGEGFAISTSFKHPGGEALRAIAGRGTHVVAETPAVDEPEQRSGNGLVVALLLGALAFMGGRR